MKKYGAIGILLMLLVCLGCFFLLSGKNEVSVPFQKRFNEKYYVKKYCRGQIEYVLPDRTRVDCLTSEYAVEFDRAKKWAEAVGQSLYYSKMTGKKPAVALILNDPKDKKFVKRIKIADEGITVFEIYSE